MALDEKRAANTARGIWWDRSFSVVSGCNWRNEGGPPRECEACWMESYAKMRPSIRGCAAGKRWDEVATHPERLAWLKPTGPALVWLTSIQGDLFHPEVPNEFIADVLHRAYDMNFCRAHAHAPLAPHRVAILTKRYGRAARWFRETTPQLPADLPIPAREARTPWLLLMFSAGTQAMADRACAAAATLPAGLRWGLHVEPLIERVKLPLDEWTWHKRLDGSHDLGAPSGHVAATVYSSGTWFTRNQNGVGGENGTERNFDSAVSEATAAVRRAGHYAGPVRASWVVCGSENGSRARPFDLAWARSIQAQCAAAGVPYWFKGAHKQVVPPEMAVRQTPWTSEEPAR